MDSRPDPVSLQTDKDVIWYGVLFWYSPTSVLGYQNSLICGRAIRNVWLNAT